MVEKLTYEQQTLKTLKIKSPLSNPWIQGQDLTDRTTWEIHLLIKLALQACNHRPWCPVKDQCQALRANLWARLQHQCSLLPLRLESEILVFQAALVVDRLSSHHLYLEWTQMFLPLLNIWELPRGLTLRQACTSPLSLRWGLKLPIPAWDLVVASGGLKSPIEEADLMTGILHLVAGKAADRDLEIQI